MIPAVIEVSDIVRLAPPWLPAPLPPIVIRPDEFCLKKLKIHEDMSEETNAFSAEVWVKNKLVAYAKNDGRGGSTFMHQAGKGALDAAEVWASTFPPESSYQRVYASLECAGSEYSDLTKEKMATAYWAHTSKVDLERLVDSFVDAAAAKKAIRGLSSHILCGPQRSRMDELPGIRKFKKVPTQAQMEYARSLYVWVCPLADVFDLPYHYYPAPHPFHGSGWPKQKVTVADRAGEVCYSGTNDHQVAVRFDDKPEDTSFFKPEEVQLAEA